MSGVLISSGNRHPELPSFKVYPDHFVIEDAETGRTEVSVYLSAHHMRVLGEGLVEQATSAESDLVWRDPESQWGHVDNMLHALPALKNALSDDQIDELADTINRHLQLITLEHAGAREKEAFEWGREYQRSGPHAAKTPQVTA